MAKTYKDRYNRQDFKVLKRKKQYPKRKDRNEIKAEKYKKWEETPN
jgi:hypothetical protein